ncbi:hypothetical protein SNEBB_002659 [Seison nebaliae]|nr:hypothetical protein SNEBB_002659 [Seison nebaliae]
MSGEELSMKRRSKHSQSAIFSEIEPENVKLKQEISLMDAISIIVGTIIGSGIFISTKGVLEGTGSIGMSLIVWLVSGITAFMGANCYGELGVAIPRSGGDYSYFQEICGPFWAFLRLYCDAIIIRPSAAAVNALAFAYYLLEPIYGNCGGAPSGAIRLLAIFLIITLAVINIVKTKLSLRVQDVSMISKVFALCAIIVMGIVLASFGYVDQYKHNLWTGTNTSITSIALSFYQALFAYHSWHYLNTVAEEVKNPKKNIPLAIFISLFIVIFTYCGTVASYYTVLSAQESLNTDAVAVTFTEKVYGPLKYVTPIFVALSTMGGVNGQMLTASRLFYVGAREGQMPEVLVMLNVRRATPVMAIIVTAFVMMMYLISVNVVDLVNYTGLAMNGPLVIVVALVIYYRIKHPEIPRPFKTPIIFAYIFVIVIGGVIILSIFESPVIAGVSILLIISGIPFYLIFIYPGVGKKYLRNSARSVTRLLQKIFLLVPPEDNILLTRNSEVAQAALVSITSMDRNDGDVHLTTNFGTDINNEVFHES